MQLIGSVAYGSVEDHLRRQGRSLGLSQTALVRDMRARGVMVGKTEQVAHEGERPRAWSIRRSLLGIKPNPADGFVTCARQALRSA